LNAVPKLGSGDIPSGSLRRGVAGSGSKNQLRGGSTNQSIDCRAGGDWKTIVGPCTGLLLNGCWGKERGSLGENL